MTWAPRLTHAHVREAVHASGRSVAELAARVGLLESAVQRLLDGQTCHPRILELISDAVAWCGRADKRLDARAHDLAERFVADWADGKPTAATYAVLTDWLEEHTGISGPWCLCTEVSPGVYHRMQVRHQLRVVLAAEVAR